MLQQLEQYKHERECNLVIGRIKEDKIARLESLMDGILTAEEFKANELVSLKSENKVHIPFFVWTVNLVMFQSVYYFLTFNYTWQKWPVCEGWVTLLP